MAEISKARRRVQESIEQAEAERRRLTVNKRIELAASGLKAFQAKKPTEAARSFKTYLRILEDWKGVAEGGLNPNLFDRKKDASELLLISGVYWDLVKLYDRTKSTERRTEFFHYLEKFILFSKGMPYQGLCAETLRKYIAVEQPAHKEDFKRAYRMIGNNQCFIATELTDVLDLETLPRLRGFRERTLRRSGIGRRFIAWYYRNGPGLARRISGFSPRKRKILGLLLDGLAKLTRRT